MISVEAWTTIRYLKAQGLGMRRIVREVGVARNTVRQALRSEGPPKYQEATASQCKAGALQLLGGRPRDELLNFLSCPRAHWRKIRTTNANAIESAFREVRRRTRPMSCFQNTASVDRIIYGVINHLNSNLEE